MVKAIQVLVEKCDLAVMHAQAFPYAIARNQAAVKNRYTGLVASKILTVDVNDDCGDARFVLVFVRTLWFA